MPELHDSIVRLYDTVFGRAPDADGLRFWDDSAHHGTTLDVMANQFIAAPEFAATYGQPDSTSFVSSMYANVLDRPGEAAGVSFWAYGLDHGLSSRADVVVAFSESAEHIAHLAAPAAAPVTTTAPAADPTPVATTTLTADPTPTTTTAPATDPVVAHDPVPTPTPDPVPTPATTAPTTTPVVTDTTPAKHEISAHVGAEILFGTAAADVFVMHDMRSAAGDTLYYFVPGEDVADFRGFDLLPVGNAPFNGQPSIRWAQDTSLAAQEGGQYKGNTIIEWDANGDHVADGSVLVLHVLLSSTDFLFS